MFSLVGDQLPAAAITISPWTDLGCTGESITARAAADPVLGPEFLDNAVRLVTAGVDPRDAAVSPLYADLSGLPPLLIHCGEDEMLLDDSVRLAERAKAAGVDVNTRAIELPDDAALIEELCALEARPTPAGFTRIAAAGSGRDDRAVALAGAVIALRKARQRIDAMPISVGWRRSVWDDGTGTSPLSSLMGAGYWR